MIIDITYVISYYHSIMTTLTASKARINIYGLLDQVAKNHKPILITGKRHNGILISEEDWSALQETLQLLSVPGMRESIRKGIKTPLSKCSKKLNW